MMTRHRFCGRVFMVMIRQFFCFYSTKRVNFLRKSHDITAVELLALCANNILYYAQSFEMEACYLEKAQYSL